MLHPVHETARYIKNRQVTWLFREMCNFYIIRFAHFSIMDKIKIPDIKKFWSYIVMKTPMSMD